MTDSPSNSPNICVLGPKSQLSGELRAEEDVRIEGVLDGSVQIHSHTLTVGASGKLKGTALAKTIVVEGAVEGDLYALEIIKVMKGARVNGDLHSARIAFEDGAMMRGAVEMDPDVVKKSIGSKFGQTLPSTSSTPAAGTTAGTSAGASAPARPATPPTGATRPVQDSTKPAAPAGTPSQNAVSS